MKLHDSKVGLHYVEETKHLIKRVTSALGDRLVGWDIAIGP
jgi:hypothetical protein